ncbi:hypothetical protein XAP6164_4400004 [Xanthomonas phaseoli pv. phaseoli]|uniref:Transposase n=1 Tax=Xanthomonas campestris pv. phaseoli TaxID=317013 RepID=A0AB38DU83_XANCH|nr:hypothetical protein XAP7430_1060015 [Xanthomonas phaseoli pv. phaseoli]SOO30479.1 hypothetical protein XAP6164_4400004 [Xanthomonas phaseoli pv. phaseoli]
MVTRFRLPSYPSSTLQVISYGATLKDSPGHDRKVNASDTITTRPCPICRGDDKDGLKLMRDMQFLADILRHPPVFATYVAGYTRLLDACSLHFGVAARRACNA